MINASLLQNSAFAGTVLFFKSVISIKGFLRIAFEQTHIGPPHEYFKIGRFQLQIHAIQGIGPVIVTHLTRTLCRRKNIPSVIGCKIHGFQQISIPGGGVSQRKVITGHFGISRSKRRIELDGITQQIKSRSMLPRTFETHCLEIGILRFIPVLQPNRIPPFRLRQNGE